MSENTPQELAENCAKAMFSRDRASQKLGMKIESIAPGRAVLSMAVTEDMIQGHGSWPTRPSPLAAIPTTKQPSPPDAASTICMAPRLATY